jgi:dimethylaniline monooxygenase (N-oxide forming)
VFPVRADVEQYLEDYASAFNLMPLIHFRRTVHAVHPIVGGRWQLRIDSLDGETTEQFDVVFVCAGIFRTPQLPELPGLDTFDGTTLHSMEYRTAQPFAGQNVLVVGLGSSAADIAVDLAGSAAVTLSVRRGGPIEPRSIAGRPRDQSATRLTTRFLRRIRELHRRRIIATANAGWGLGAPGDIWREAHIDLNPSAPVLHDRLAPKIASREIALRPAISRIDGQNVLFADGGALRPDAIIFATGYRVHFPFLPADLQPWSDGSHGLYRLVFSPHYPTLPFIGVCRASGAIFPIVEMQARWVAQVLTGRATLPSPHVMSAESADRASSTTEDPPVRVQVLSYLDEIGQLIGVRPHLWRHPRLLRHLLTGPPVAAQYRLEGPNRWAGAARVLRERL